MGTKATVLIVDDDPLLLELVEHKLAAHGYRVLTAADGAVGLLRARTDEPDVIVLDIMMPMLDGRQMLQELQADRTLSAVPVVMLTARHGENDVVRALELGAADYLAKPFSPDELVARIDRLVPKARADRP